MQKTALQIVAEHKYNQFYSFRLRRAVDAFTF